MLRIQINKIGKFAQVSFQSRGGEFTVCVDEESSSEFQNVMEETRDSIVEGRDYNREMVLPAGKISIWYGNPKDRLSLSFGIQGFSSRLFVLPRDEPVDMEYYFSQFSQAMKEIEDIFSTSNKRKNREEETTEPQSSPKKIRQEEEVPEPEKNAEISEQISPTPEPSDL